MESCDCTEVWCVALVDIGVTESGICSIMNYLEVRSTGKATCTHGSEESSLLE